MFKPEEVDEKNGEQVDISVLFKEIGIVDTKKTFSILIQSGT